MRAVCCDFGSELVEEFPELVRHHCRAKRLWSGSYLVGSVGGTSLDVPRAHIEQQNRPRDAVHLA